MEPTRKTDVNIRNDTIMQNRNWFYFEFSVESSSFTFNNFKTEKFKLSVKICCMSPSNSEANCDGADAESPFLLFFSFSASFKDSSPREKVGNCLRFGTGGWSLCFYPLWSRNI